MSQPIPSASPCFLAPPTYGTFAIQQRGPGEAIQWGAYPSPEYRGDSYRATVYLGGVKVDSKNQGYPLHGSVSAQRAKKYAGMTFELHITVMDGPALVLGLMLQATIA